MCEILFYLFVIEIVYADQFGSEDSGAESKLSYLIVIQFLTAGKVTVMLLFYLQRAFENTILSGFIQFQHRFRLMELDIVKDDYQRKEKAFVRAIKLRTLIICLCMLAYYVSVVYKLQNPGYIGPFFLWTQLLPTLAIMFALGRYCTSTATLLYDMYWNHRFAFNSHVARMSLTFVLQVICILAFLQYQTYTCLVWLCFFSSEPGNEAMYDANAADPGLCGYFNEKLAETRSAKKSFENAIMGIDLILLVPVLFFFLLDRPHDCFKCLGKDPSRIYSTYQLTREETAQRMISAKIGMKDAEFKLRAQKRLIEQVIAGEIDYRVTVVANTIDEQQLIPLPGSKQPIIDELVYRYGGSILSLEDDEVLSSRFTEAVYRHRLVGLFLRDVSE